MSICMEVVKKVVKSYSDDGCYNQYCGRCGYIPTPCTERAKGREREREREREETSMSAGRTDMVIILNTIADTRIVKQN